MGEVVTLTVEAEDDGVRLDRWLRRRWPHLGQAHIQQARPRRPAPRRRRQGQGRDAPGGRGAGPRAAPAGARRPRSRPRRSPPRDAAFARSLVLFEDDQVLVLNKPAGLAVQGGTKTASHVDRLLGAWGEGERRPRLTHRLDRDTSGVLVLGKSAGRRRRPRRRLRRPRGAEDLLGDRRRAFRAAARGRVEIAAGQDAGGATASA